MPSPRIVMAAAAGGAGSRYRPGASRTEWSMTMPATGATTGRLCAGQPIASSARIAMTARMDAILPRSTTRPTEATVDRTLVRPAGIAGGRPQRVGVHPLAVHQHQARVTKVADVRRGIAVDEHQIGGL